MFDLLGWIIFGLIAVALADIPHPTKTRGGNMKSNPGYAAVQQQE